MHKMNFKEISMPYKGIKNFSILTKDDSKSILKINKGIIIFSNNFYYYKNTQHRNKQPHKLYGKIP